MAKRVKQQKTNYASLIMALIIIIIIYSINRLLFTRPLLWVFAVILITLFLKQFIKMNKRVMILSIVILFFASIVVDGIIVTIFKRIPAFTYSVISSEKINIYYSPGLRVWQCDENNYNDLIVSQFYNQGYVCDANDISSIDINSFLSSVVENYDDYGNKYVKINGKISKKNSQTSIEMRPYTESEIKVNGYVEFSNNIVLKIFFEKPSEEIDNYDVYDDITILGLVKNLEGTSGNYIIYMDNARVLSTTNLTDFEITVTPESNCSEKNLLVENDRQKLSSYCLSEIFVSYENTTSELVDTISSNKLDIPALYANPTTQETDDNGNTMYHMKNYNILVCNESTSKEVFIGKKSMNFNDVVCEQKTE